MCKHVKFSIPPTLLLFCERFNYHLNNYPFNSTNVTTLVFLSTLFSISHTLLLFRERFNYHLSNYPFNSTNITTLVFLFIFISITTTIVSQKKSISFGNYLFLVLSKISHKSPHETNTCQNYSQFINK